MVSRFSKKPLFKADLHIHSRHSLFPYFPRLRLRSSYSAPLEIYRTARKRGMNLVTITDYNTIDGCLEVLDRLGEVPDFMISEEVESCLPQSGRKIHLNVFDINEEQHRRIQELRGNFPDLREYLKDQRIPSSFNHFIDTFACAAPPEPILQDLLDWFDLFEVRDGARVACYNRVMERLIWAVRQGGFLKGFVGGSNAHTLRRIGTTYTASGATNREEFMEDLRRGETLPFGADGSCLGMTGDIYRVIFGFYLSLFPGGEPEFPKRDRISASIAALLSLPPVFLGFPLVAVRIHFSRIHARLREIHGRLELMDVLAFRERIGNHAPPPPVRRVSRWPGPDPAGHPGSPTLTP